MESPKSRRTRAVDFVSSQSRVQRQKVDVCNEVLRRLKDLNVEETRIPGFEYDLRAHFSRLPIRYALDLNVERAQDVLMHKQLLHMALQPATRPAIEVRLVQVHSSSSSSNGGNDESVYLTSARKLDAQCSAPSRIKSTHPLSAFGTSPDLELLNAANQLQVQHNTRLMHEITISTNDKPKLLSQLASLITEIGLVIQEAHLFSTVDGYILSIFVVDSSELEETEPLKTLLVKKFKNISKIQ